MFLSSRLLCMESDGQSSANPKCGDTYTYQFPIGQGRSFFCHPSLKGRYVIIRFVDKDKPLTLCEVEVYSERRACPMQAIGVASSDAFQNNRFSASSTSGNNEAFKGRLNGDGAWLPNNNNNANDYLQIDLLYEFVICAVATQGNPSADHWTTKYKLQLALIDLANNWLTYQENSVDKEFNGNSGRNDIVKLRLKEYASARFIRFQPTSYKNNKALRVEVFGILISTVPSQAPSAFTVAASSSTSITASWQLPPKYARHGIITGFKLFYGKKASERSPTILTYNDASLNGLVSGLDKYAEYEFQVLAFTSVGDGPKSSVVVERTKEDAPGIPAFLTYIVQGPDISNGPRIKLIWQKPVEPNGVIRSYTVSYNHRGNTQKEISGIDTLSYTVDVLGGVQYQFYVRAVTIKRGPDASLNVEVPEYRPSVGPANVSFVNYNKTTFKISWLPLTREKSYGKVILYDVKQELLSTEKRRKRSPSNSRTLNTTATFVVLYDLPLCSLYHVSVRAYTKAGPGPYTQPRVLETSKSEAPSDLRSTNSGSTEVTLEWTKPEVTTEGGLSYTVKYSGTKSYDNKFKHGGTKDAGKSTTFTVVGLVPGSNYKFEVYGTSVCGESLAIVLNEETKIEAPIAPVVGNVTDVTVSESVAGIYLWPVEQRNGPISAYQVIVLKVVDSEEHLPDDYDSKLKDSNNANKNNLNFYVTAEVLNVSVYEKSWEFTVGDDTMHGGFVNKPLEKGEEYIIFQRALTRDKDEILAGVLSMVAKISTRAEVPPRIAEEVSSSSVMCEIQTLCTLSCHATSDFPFNYSWTKNGQVPVSDDIKIMNNIIVLTPRDAEDYGVYVCHATNRFGFTAYKITVSEGHKSSALTDVKRNFNATVSTLSCIVFILILIIGVLIWRARRALPIDRATTTDKVITDNIGQPDSPRDQHVSEPSSYMELHPRSLEGQSHAPPEYTSLQGKDKNTEYYNVGFCKRGNAGKRKSPPDQHVSEPATYMELQPRPSGGQSHALREYKSLQGTKKNPGYYNVGLNKGNKQDKQEELYDEVGNAQC